MHPCATPFACLGRGPPVRQRNKTEENEQAQNVKTVNGFHQSRSGVRGLGRGSFVPLTPDPSPPKRGRGEIVTCPSPNDDPAGPSPAPLPLSIVIPSHNRADLLRTCLTTVMRHRPPGTQVIVVDDGSPGGAASGAAGGFAGVEIVKLERRCGFCVAANAGIHVARGAIVELLNDDTEVTEGWADAALAGFDDPLVGAVAPLVLCRPGADAALQIDSAGDCYYLGGVAGKRGHRQPLGPAYLHRRHVFGASASSAFFRREAILRAGAFPESFVAYFEDVDLAFRLHWAGYQVLFEPASRVFHHVSASYGRPQRRLLERQSQNEERVFWRNLPGRTLLRSLPLHFAVLAGKAWRRWQEGSLMPFICGRLRVLGELSAMASHRRWLRSLGPGKGAAGTGLNSWHIDHRFLV